MTDEEIRFAIAKHLGLDLRMYCFTFKPRVNDGFQTSPTYSTREEAEHVRTEEMRRWNSPTTEVVEVEDVDETPRWTEDLNAIHQLEKKLRVGESFRYPDILKEIVHADWKARGQVPVTCPDVVYANARQRAIAFLIATEILKSYVPHLFTR